MAPAAHSCVLALFAICITANGQVPLRTATKAGERQTPVVTLAHENAIARESRKVLDEVTKIDGPGAAILISQGNHIVYEDARGRADIELDVPMSTKNVFRIASVTKMFTAATILKLAEAHRLSLDDPLSSYLPDFPNGQTITIRELLSHTAGVSETPTGVRPYCPSCDLDTAAQIAEIRMRPLDFAPGTRWSYSNSGFIVLGAVIEKVTGQPWNEAIAKQILEPLGLSHTFHAQNTPIVLGRAAGYSTDPKTHVVENAPYFSMTRPAAAGALESTVDDLRLWMHALASGAVVSKESFREMSTPGSPLPGLHTGSAYGLGMYVWRVRDHTVIGHTGQVNGYASFLGYIPDSDVTVIVLANDDNFDAQTVGRRLTAIASGQPYPALIPRQLSAEELRAIPGRYQFDENTIETLSVRDNRLYAQRGNRNALPLQMTTGGEIHFVPDELTYFKPVRDASGRITELDYFQSGEGPAKPLPRQ